MGFVMVDADEWFPQGKRDSLRGLESNEQSHRQARSLRGGDGIELSRLDSRIAYAVCTTGIKFRRCSRAASSGTTPPYSACSLICEETALDKTRPSRTTAALVSSQEVSRAKRVMLIVAACRQTAAFLRKMNCPASAESRYARFAELSFHFAAILSASAVLGPPLSAL